MLFLDVQPDDYNVFRKVYETPILKSRAPDASVSEIELGESRTAQVCAQVSNNSDNRVTDDICITKATFSRQELCLEARYFAIKESSSTQMCDDYCPFCLQTLKNLLFLAEFVVFITPTALQLEMFSKILNPNRLDDLIQSSTAESLALINILTKISNSPILLKATADSIQKKKETLPSMQQSSVIEALNLLPDNAHIADVASSGPLIFSFPRVFSGLTIKSVGKLLVLSKILKTLRQVRFLISSLSSNLCIHSQNTSEKCVLVSHYTSTLNILEAFCRKMTYSYFRLDG